jgi:glycosyltransferase involved in cell wall biosynthesis
MLIEAMSCGVPVVATGSGEMPYVIGDAGRIVPERDPAQLAGALDALLDNPDERRALTEAGVERARALFSWPVVARQHLDFFEAVADQREQRV